MITRQLNKATGGLGRVPTSIFESVGQYNGDVWLGKNIKGWNLMGSVVYTWFNGYTSAAYIKLRSYTGWKRAW